MADPGRARRLAKRINTIVASAIEFEIKDPGLDGVTIVDAKVTNDLHDATVFYTVMGPTLDEEPDYEAAAAALERAERDERDREETHRDHPEQDLPGALPSGRTSRAKQREHQKYRADDEKEGPHAHKQFDNVVSDLYGSQ